MIGQSMAPLIDRDHTAAAQFGCQSIEGRGVIEPSMQGKHRNSIDRTEAKPVNRQSRKIKPNRF
jgi:hypothetical protein